MMARKRIFVLGGVPDSLLIFRKALLREMIAEGHDVMTGSAPCSPGQKAQLESLGAAPFDVPIRRAGLNPLGDIRTLMCLRRLFKSQRPDVLLSYTIKPVIYGSLVARWTGVGSIHSLITGLGYAFLRENWKQRAVGVVARRLYESALQFNRSVLFQNNDDRIEFERQGIIRHGQRVAVVNGSGVDLDEFQARRPRAGTVRFLMIGRLYREKGVFEFLDAACAIRRRYPEVEFALIGPTDPNPTSISRGEIESRLREAGMNYVEWMEDVRPALEAASVYVLPSYREGTPHSVLQAMAVGRPIITTDAPGCRETVVPGRNGFLVAIKSVSDLVAAMERYIQEPGLAGAHGLESRRIAEQKYDVRLVNSQILTAMGLQVDRWNVPHGSALPDEDSAALGPRTRQAAPVNQRAR